MRRILRIMREHGILACDRPTSVRGPDTHDRTITTKTSDEMWAIDATGCLTDEGNAAVFVVVDHCTGECLGVRAARRGTRLKAIECLREAIHSAKGRYEIEVAAGTKLRHDHGSQFISHAFQDELKTLRIESSPSFVRQPEGNGCVERFIRTLKEQLLWLRRFRTVEERLGEFLVGPQSVHKNSNSTQCRSLSAQKGALDNSPREQSHSGGTQQYETDCAQCTCATTPEREIYERHVVDINAIGAIIRAEQAVAHRRDAVAAYQHTASKQRDQRSRQIVSDR